MKELRSDAQTGASRLLPKGVGEGIWKQVLKKEDRNRAEAR